MRKVKRNKGLSEIFSSLIVTLIVLSLSVPLMLYFNSLNNSQTNNVGNSFQHLNSALDTKITVIQIGNTPNQIYLYSYGNYPAKIQQLIINKTAYPLNITIIKPDQLIPLSKISTKIPSKTYINVTMLIEINGNYYTFEI